MFALIVACGGGDDGGLAAGDGGSVVVATVTRQAEATPAGTPVPLDTPSASATDAPATLPPGEPTSEAPTPEDTALPEATATPAPPASGSGALTGFIYPISGGCLPQGDQLMPNAPREYRLGTHEGIDFYGVDNCVAIGLGTPVLAAKGGTVIRADVGYVDLTQQSLNVILADPTSAESFDAFRGRQVWIDHGNGIVTRYCHLSGVAAGLAVGDTVAQGEEIAYVGESGTPGSVVAPGTEYHLHWEVRVGDSYLGAGLPPAEVRAQYLSLFGQ